MNKNEVKFENKKEIDNKKMNEKEKEIIKNKKQKKRKGKFDLNGRTFQCKICKKSYLSYPALYTHNRNKHDIIPITDKPTIFTSKKTSSNKYCFKYNQSNISINNNDDISQTLNYIINSFHKINQRYILNKDSKFFKSNYIFNCDPFFLILSNNFKKIEFNSIPKKDSNIYQVIIIYLIRLIKITNDDEFKYLLVNVAYFLREYLNMVGWDYKQNQMTFKKEKIQNTNNQDFCLDNTCEEIPEMIEDFVSIYILLIDDLKNKQKEVADICQNFFCWLYINQLTSYKLKRINEEIK
jgi:hypothetical protein